MVVVVVTIGFVLPDVSGGDAIGIAVTGMLIVFVALLMLSLFIAMLPRILNVVAERFPESDGLHAHSASRADSPVDQEEDHVLAAIGFVLHLRQQDQRKLE